MFPPPAAPAVAPLGDARGDARGVPVAVVGVEVVREALEFESSRSMATRLSW